MNAGRPDVDQTEVDALLESDSCLIGLDLNPVESFSPPSTSHSSRSLCETKSYNMMRGMKESKNHPKSFNIIETSLQIKDFE